MQDTIQPNLNLNLKEALQRTFAPRVGPYNQYDKTNFSGSNHVVKFGCKKRVVTYKSGRTDTFIGEKYEFETPVRALTQKEEDEVLGEEKELLQAAFNENFNDLAKKASPWDRKEMAKDCRRATSTLIEDGCDEEGGTEIYSFDKYSWWAFDRMYYHRMVCLLNLLKKEAEPVLEARSTYQAINGLMLLHDKCPQFMAIYYEWRAMRPLASLYWNMTERDDIFKEETLKRLDRRGEAIVDMIEDNEGLLHHVLDDASDETTYAQDLEINDILFRHLPEWKLELTEKNKLKHKSMVEAWRILEKECLSPTSLAKMDGVPEDSTDADDDEDDDDEEKEAREIQAMGEELEATDF